MRTPSVLILCERSGTIRNAFARAGWYALSVDTLDTTAEVGHMGDGRADHLVGDALDWCEGGKHHSARVWDLVIARPPCTYLTNSGVRWLFEEDADGEPTQRAQDRWRQLAEAKRFFNAMLTANSHHIAVENPVPHKHAVDGVDGIGKPTQTVQPYDFGHHETKRTGWWLRNLPPLQPTHDVKAETMALPYAERAKVHHASPGPDRWMVRSALVQGMADAMVSQWGDYARHPLNIKGA